MKQSAITTYLDDLFTITTIDDYSLNGLQVEGSSEVNHIGFAVDSGLEVFEKAVKLGVDFLIVHHGLFWKGADTRMVGVYGKRVRTLLDADISLYGVHLPLDMHDILGNNVELIRIIGGKVTGGIGKHGSGYIGKIGVCEPQSLSTIADTYRLTLGATPTIIGNASTKVTKIAALSGAASRGDLLDAAAQGIELFITGEQSEWYHDAADYGISVMFLGHHASETTGVRALQKVMSEQFSAIKTVFIECPTGL